MGFILFILLLAGGILAFLTLTRMEKEIRAEIASAEASPGAEQPAPEPRGKAEPVDSLEERICHHVRISPELLQTDLYIRLPEYDRKLIQKSVLNLERSGKLNRVRSGNSYKLTGVE